MDKLSHVSRSTAAAPCFKHLPHDVLKHVLHYLPIKGARNVFRLLSKSHLASTDYLRIAGLVQARIRSRAVGETQIQASIRFTNALRERPRHLCWGWKARMTKASLLLMLAVNTTTV